MNRRTRGARIGSALRAIVAAALVTFTLPFAAPPTSAAEALGETVNLAGLYALRVRGLLSILGNSPDAATLAAALGDARRAVAEIDREVARASVSPAGESGLRTVRQTAAAAYLHLALFETRALDFESARRDVDRAHELSSVDADGGLDVEWSASQEGRMGQALITRSELLSLPAFEAALALAWARARPVTFDLYGLEARDLVGLEIVSAPRASVLGSDRPLLERGASAWRKAIEAPQSSFTVPLPAGTYRLRGQPGSRVDRIFIVPETSEMDPVVLGPSRFALRVERRERTHGPHFFLNGVEVPDLTAMPYGVYRVKVEEGYPKSAPAAIRFIPGLGLNDRSRTTWTIFVPEGGMTVLWLGGSPLGGRLRESP